MTEPVKEKGLRNKKIKKLLVKIKEFRSQSQGMSFSNVLNCIFEVSKLFCAVLFINKKQNLTKVMDEYKNF